MSRIQSTDFWSQTVQTNESAGGLLPTVITEFDPKTFRHITVPPVHRIRANVWNPVPDLTELEHNYGSQKSRLSLLLNEWLEWESKQAQGVARRGKYSYKLHIPFR